MSSPTADVLQRVLVRGEIFSELAGRFEHLQVLGVTIAALVDLLRDHWPKEANQMPVYPAFV